MSRNNHTQKNRRDLREWAAEHGWLYRGMTGSGHLRFEHPEVRDPVFGCCTPRVSGNTIEKAKMQRALKFARNREHA
jgi:hypothetical protein